MTFRAPLLALALLTGIGGLDRAVAATRPVQEQAPLAAVFACYRRAYDGTRLDGTSIARLCQGASDASPADCFIAAHAGTRLADADAIALCRCAPSTEPVQCFSSGEAITLLDRTRVLTLCSPEQRFQLDAECRAPSR
jgi:hypothetical protein